MNISEIFVSISGESVNAGLRTVFIRTFGCNCECSFCDSLYAIKGSDYRQMSVNEIMEEVNKFDCKRVVLTGGEPTLQQDSMDLIQTLLDEKYSVELETNGAVDLEPFEFQFGENDSFRFTMDWKCPSSGVNDKMIRSNLDLLSFDDVIKFVVGSKEDLEEMNRVYRETDAMAYVSPVFGKIEPKEIAEYIINNKLNYVRLQVQLHKICFDPYARGV